MRLAYFKFKKSSTFVTSVFSTASSTRQISLKNTDKHSNMSGSAFHLQSFEHMMSSQYPIEAIVASLVTILALITFKFRNVGSREFDFPPGPKSTFMLGNALDFPTSFPHIK